MNEYQMLQQRGVQELVEVALDEDGLPCVYLHDIGRRFPNASMISAYGARVGFVLNSSGVPKQPLRIPYLENRVLDVESDNSALEWSREATAARMVAAAASAAPAAPTNTVHTRPVTNGLGSDCDQHAFSGIYNDSDSFNNYGSDSDSNNAESEDFFDMTESVASSDDEENLQDAQLEELLRPSRMPVPIPISPPATTTSFIETSSSVASERTLGTVQSYERLRLGPLTPVPEHSYVSGHVVTNTAIINTSFQPFTRDSPPAFEEIEITSTQLISAVIPTTDADLRHTAVSEAPEEDRLAPAPPSYEVLDSGTHRPHQPSTPMADDALRAPAATLDDPAERHLVLDRNRIIKRIAQSILGQKYEADSCPHPPLFVLLPENPLQWSFDNILHNKMRLHFLCDCCRHERTYNTDQDPLTGFAAKQNLHVNDDRGFEVRMDRFEDQLLLIKFGHYILHLLRILQYGVSLDDMFVAAAFDQLVPLPISYKGALVMNPELHFKQKLNVERSVAFMETLLGDEYEDEAAEVVRCVDMNDFRLLDSIVKRPPYARSEASRFSVSDSEQDLDLSDIHQGGSGLYKVLQADGNVRWSCAKFYSLSYHKPCAAHDRHTRTVDLSAVNKGQFDIRVIAISKLKALFRIEIMLNWDIEKGHFAGLMMTLQRETKTVSAIVIRLNKHAVPLAWRKGLQSKDGDDQQPISEVISLFKSRNIRHVELEGDIDPMTVPNIGTMDLSNLDILSIMKSNNRGYQQQHKGSPPDSSYSTVEGVNNVPASPRTYTQETYIPQLVSFLNCCSLLTELSLGFPDAVPGHIRILNACMTSLSRLQRLDLYRVLSTSTSGNRNNTTARINRKLEFSVSLSASKIMRLYLADCKTTSEGKTKLLESLEELLMDAGPSLEDLELRYVGFNDKHAHALEVGTKPFTGQHACRLRRLVIHGKGLEIGGVSALKRVLRRATKPMRQNNAHSPNRSGNGIGTGGTSTHSIVSMAAAESSTSEHLETLSFGIMLEQATLLHLELCSIDSLNDSDWASLLSELSPKRLLTLDLQGVRFGDRAMAMLARNTGDEMDDFLFAPSSSSSLSFAPLQLQTLRLGCPTLSHKGVIPLREFLSRLTHLSTLSLHGFRTVTAEQWIDMMARVAFRWIEVIEVVSPGYDDECAQYLGDRIQTRSQPPSTETTSSADVSRESFAEPALPLYSTQSPATTSSDDATVTAASTSSDPISGTRFERRDSISSRFFGSITSSSLALNGRKRSLEKSSLEKSPGNLPALALQTSSTAPPSPSQKYLEIDLRYTDVSAKGLSLLRSQMGGQAKKVIVRTRDDEEREEVDSNKRENNDDQVESNKLAAKLREERESDNVSSRADGNERRGSRTQSKPFVTVSSSSALFAYHTSSVAMAPEQQQQSSSQTGNGGNTSRQANLSSSTAKLSKLKTFFSKK
ncbi:hypothetical protein BGZ75_000131 [Mortierella antarctica]|nr:hypothetical protein BGZ75_000131 [Mortierella antarctica]